MVDLAEFNFLQKLLSIYILISDKLEFTVRGILLVSIMYGKYEAFNHLSNRINNTSFFFKNSVLRLTLVGCGLLLVFGRSKSSTFSVVTLARCCKI